MTDDFSEVFCTTFVSVSSFKWMLYTALQARSLVKMSLFVRDDDGDDDEEIVITLPREPVVDGGSCGENEQAVQAEQVDQDEQAEQDEYPLLPPKEDEDLVHQTNPVNISLTLPLKFQQLVLEDLIADDSLLVLGKGLGLGPIVANLLHTLSAPATIANVRKQALIILLSADDNDNETIDEELTELSWIDDEDGEENKRPYVIIKSELYTSDKRRALYSKGGIMSVTSTIFILDMLSGIVDTDKVTGLVILHAERVTDLSNESFIAHIYRQKNKWGFIKAVSDCPEVLMSGFAPLQKKLRDMRLKKVILWPRFHIQVSSSLMVKESTRSVTEVKVRMTDAMKQIQTGLYACLTKCIDELRRKNPTLSIDYWSIENALDPRFLGTIHMILDPHWHRISYDSKQLVKDIKLLKDLIKCLLSYDCVDFYEKIQLVLEANRPSIDKRQTESPWLLAEESQTVVTFAKKRVFDNDEYLLEQAPKWEQLAIVLDDASNERAHDPSKNGPVLIMCSDTKVKRQLTRVIATIRESKDKTFSARKIMVNKLQMYLDNKDLKSRLATTIQEAAADNEDEIQISRAFAKTPVVTKRRRTRGGAAMAAVSRLHNAPTQGDDIESKMKPEEVEMELMDLEVADDQELDAISDQEGMESINDPGKFYSYIGRENQVIIGTYTETTVDKILQETMPSFIVMYEPDLAFIRRVEVYQSVHKENPARTFFMYYSDSLEEQSHLTAIRKEKDAFTKLIREKSTLAVRYEADEDFKIHRVRKAIPNTRIAGGAKFKDRDDESTVLVDSREFRAPLPGLLHRTGLRVVPCVLTVGDYILTPQVCVERKSIPDLMSSLASGRLYEQCARMSKYYAHPALLIEFDSNQSFSLEPFSGQGRPGIKERLPVSSNKMQESIQKDLAALVINFPAMRILWSSSPYQTAEIMVELKAGREEPNIVEAVNAGLDEAKQRDNIQLGKNVVALLQSIPGITNVDFYLIMRKVKDVNKLMSLTRHELVKIVGEDLGGRIHDYLTTNYKDD